MHLALLKGTPGLQAPAWHGTAGAGTVPTLAAGWLSLKARWGNEMTRSGRWSRKVHITNDTGRGGITGTMPAPFLVMEGSSFWGTALIKTSTKVVREDTHKHVWHSCSKVPPHTRKQKARTEAQKTTQQFRYRSSASDKQLKSQIVLTSESLHCFPLFPERFLNTADSERRHVIYKLW